ncbi:GTP 3',8-cyclase MoaA [Chloroherpeton thalassium]|nr:GTP 3',8-cyclase MoaA [Chloroherpeton thalassium]
MMQQNLLADRFGRRVNYLRVAVTDRCNFRCVYCMPEKGIRFKPATALLSAKEILRVIGLAGSLGVEKVRFTGGEPLLREDLPEILSEAAALPGIRSLHLTTNGLLLGKYLPALKKSGIHGVNISLDALQRERFRKITRRDAFQTVWENILQTLDAGIPEVKINVVALADLSESELVQFVALTQSHKVTVRFIELMPFNHETESWRTNAFTSAKRVLRLLNEHFSGLIPLEGSATEQQCFAIRDHRGKVAIIPAYTRSMCGSCSRLRLTADGKLLNCLYAESGEELRDLLRLGISDEILLRTIQKAVFSKPKNGMLAQPHDSGKQTCMTEIGG